MIKHKNQFDDDDDHKNNHLLELAFDISLVSFGSSHTLFLPHFKTAEASLFCNFNELIYLFKNQLLQILK